MDPFQGSGTSIRDLKQQQAFGQMPQQQPQQHMAINMGPPPGFPMYQDQGPQGLQQPLLRPMVEQYYMDEPQQQQQFMTKSRTMTKSDWIEVVVVLVMFVLFSSSTIYQFESSFMPHQLLGYDQPPIFLVILNGIIFTIIFMLLQKFNCF